MGSEYPSVKLSTVAEIIMGQSPPGTTYNKIGKGLPFYQGVTDFGSRYPSRRVFCTAPTRIAKPGDILLSVRAPIGAVNVASEESAIGRGLAIIRPHNPQNRIFIEFVLRAKRSEWHALEGGGSVFGNAKKNDLESLEIVWPEEKIRNSVSSILGALDDKIELNNEMNRTLEEMGQAIFKSWFVDFEPFRNGEFEYNNELQKEIPRGWGVRSVYSLADYINGMAFKMSDFSEEGLPIIKIAELNNGVTDTTKFYNGEYNEKYFLRNGDILFSWSASLGIYLWDGGNAILNQHIFNVKPKGIMTKPIMYFLLKEIVKEFIQIAAFRATTMGHIKISHLQERKVAVPDDKSVKILNDKLEPIFNSILANKLENHSLVQIRDALLPKLMSGEIRGSENK